MSIEVTFSAHFCKGEPSAPENSQVTLDGSWQIGAGSLRIICTLGECFELNDSNPLQYRCQGPSGGDGCLQVAEMGILENDPPRLA